MAFERKTMTLRGDAPGWTTEVTCLTRNASK
jgi:hypothetical protein